MRVSIICRLGTAAWVPASAGMTQLPHGRALDLGVLQLAGDGHRVLGHLLEAVDGEVAAARVADEDLGAPACAASMKASTRSASGRS